MASNIAAKVSPGAGALIGASCGMAIFGGSYYEFIGKRRRSPSFLTFASLTALGGISGTLLGAVAPIPVIACGVGYIGYRVVREVTQLV